MDSDSLCNSVSSRLDPSLTSLVPLIRGKQKICRVYFFLENCILKKASYRSGCRSSMPHIKEVQFYNLGPRER